MPQYGCSGMTSRCSIAGAFSVTRPNQRSAKCLLLESEPTPPYARLGLDNGRSVVFDPVALVPGWEWNDPALGTARSLTGNGSFPNWEEVVPYLGKNPYPRRERIVPQAGEVPRLGTCRTIRAPVLPTCASPSAHRAMICIRSKDGLIKRACDLDANLARCLFHVKQNKNKFRANLKLSGRARKRAKCPGGRLRFVRCRDH